MSVLFYGHKHNWHSRNYYRFINRAGCVSLMNSLALFTNVFKNFQQPLLAQKSSYFLILLSAGVILNIAHARIVSES